MNWSNDDRGHLAELIREDDRLRAERSSEPIRRGTVSETDADGLVYRTHDNNASLPTPQPDAEADFSDDVDLATALDEFSKATVDRFRALERENAELRGKVDALLILLGQKSFKAADVIDLPDWRKRDVA